MKTLYTLPLAFLLFACAQNKTTMTDADAEPQTLIVLLEERADPKEVLAVYEQIDLKSIQLISRSKNEIKCSLKRYSKDIDQLLNSLLSNDRIQKAHVLTEAGGDPSVTTDQNMDFSYTASRQLVIATLESADATKLLSKYDEVDVKSIKRISRSEFKFSFAVSVPKADLKEWMKALESEEGVIKVEPMDQNPDTPSSKTNEGFSKTKPIRD